MTINLISIKERLRQIDVLSGLWGAEPRADFEATCEDLAINEVAGLVAEIERLRAEVEDWKHGSRHEAEEVERLRAALAEVLVPIEALTAAGDDAWELAPEVRGELMAARTLGRAAIGIGKAS